MGNEAKGSNRDSTESSAVTNATSAAGIDWNQRAGPIFKYGLVVGFLLILLGGLSLSLALTNVFLEILVVCTGLSIILGAFGSTAKVTIPGQSMVLVGVAAVAVALFVLLMQEMDARYMHVQIEGDVKGSQLDLVGDTSYLGSFQESERAFDFVIFGKEFIKKKPLALYITLPNGAELEFECIDEQNLRPYLGSGKTIVWRFNNEKGTLINVANRQRIAALDSCLEDTDAENMIPSLPDKPDFSFSFPVISSAYAQSELQAPQDSKALIEQLDSSASYLRREARSKLAKQGLLVIHPLLAKLSKQPLSYRSRLGVIVALTKMMRENKRFRTDIIGSLTIADLIRLVEASADEDRTIRIYASEFLYDLGDPRIIPLCLERFRSASANGRYNLLLIIKGAVPHVTTEQRLTIIEDVTALKADTPKTNELIDSIVERARIN